MCTAAVSGRQRTTADSARQHLSAMAYLSPDDSSAQLSSHTHRKVIDMQYHLVAHFASRESSPDTDPRCRFDSNSTSSTHELKILQRFEQDSSQ